ncbi:MAG TPA: extracellular solute-binding protein, partial [Clostridia bacterium]|nr:extracellular solute-binding protein [Clostridia bacterium]
RAGADGVIASCTEMALSVRAAWQAGGEGKSPAVYAISSRRTFLEEDCTAYEMNYRLLGQQACRALIAQTPLPERELPADGLRKKTFAPRVAKEQTLRLLTQNSSFTQALRLLAPGLRRATGLTLKITCFPRNELFDVIEAMGTTDAYDLIRMDMHWMDWYGTRVFTPLDALPLDVNGILQKMVPGMDGEYTSVNGVRYLLPLEPSALLLFYRRDLFEDAATCRSYYETTRKELAVPETFEEYLRVAAFFSQSVHPASRTPYGCTVTHPANEFLSSLLGVLPGGKLRSFEAPECIAQFKRYLHGEQYAYLSATNQWVEAADQFIAGNCAMTILFTNYVEHIVSNPMAYVAGRVGLTKLPGMIPFLGGGVIGVPEASRHKEEAARFLEWTYDDGVSQQLALLSGCSACSVAYENPETKALYPWLDVVKASFAGGIRRGLFEGVRSPFNGKLMENHLGIACRNAADGVMTPEQAMAYAESIYRQLK